MKKSLSGLDLIPLVKELQVLAGARIDKIYQPSRGEIIISISSKEGKYRLKLLTSGWVWLAKEIGDMPVSPSAFASSLRKHISNARITAIGQHGCDRIIEIHLEKNRTMRIVIELFGDGNLILLADDDNIISIMKRRKWKHRELKIGEKYRYPPEAFDPRTADFEKLRELMSGSKGDIVRTLATKVNLGGDYAEEICRRAKIDKSVPASEAGIDILEAIWRAIKDLLRELESNISPSIAFENGLPVTLTPIALGLDKDTVSKSFSSFIEAIEEYAKHLPLEDEGTEVDQEKERVERKLKSQNEAVERLRQEIDIANRSAEYIFSNYDKIERIINEMRDLKDSGGILPGAEIIDSSAGRFRINIDDLQIILGWNKDARENAQGLYEAQKKMKSKLEGAERAIKETARQLEKLVKERSLREENAKKRTRRSKREWYEHYRWFISSEGVLVIAGKDAKSNDQLIKKHLQPGDRYVHADIHGAPSVVVKAEDGMTDATLEEAAIFSLSMSKAWNAQIGSGSGYWVKPEQVSKTPQSGEYLAKGAFVIRGKRNYFEKLEIKLAIGIRKDTDEPIVMCGPVRAVEKNCKDIIEIEPGDISKEKVAKDLSERYSVGIEDIQSVLPPGGVKITEKK